jgi:ferrochelatase
MMADQPCKYAVVLFNLGGPSEERAIRPFLFNFFMDKNIIAVPAPLRYLIAKWISWSRGGGAAKEAYRPLGGKSPLLHNTQEQARALERALQKNRPGTKVFVSMRYWHPTADDVARAVANYRPDQIVLLPLYPQYSTTTTRSSFEDWDRAAKAAGLSCKTVRIESYPADPGFVTAATDLIRRKLKDAPKRVRLLFSAHGLPQAVVAKGDPYQKQCEETAAAILSELDIPQLDWKLCYQSKVGPMKWLEPSLLDAIEEAADEKTGVVIYPLSFVSEHVETLVELDLDCAERAHSMGISYFARVPTVGTHPDFIEGLKQLVLSAPGIETAAATEKHQRIAGEKHG